jgi:signal transduction histidine kinase/HPt (histidine-containing phosphotransfer) domain-containing protein
MFGQAPEPRNDAVSAAAPNREAVAVFAGRIDLLYRLGRHQLYLPFAALCVAGMLYAGRESVATVAVPLLLQILVTVATGVLGRAYDTRNTDDPAPWAHRYAIASAASGAAWGLGAVIWFIPNLFPAEAFLALAFLGMTATEFIARCAYRPAYVAHAVFSLGPLALMLMFAGNIYASFSALLVIFFGGVLYSYCDNIAELIDESFRLRHRNAELAAQLFLEKRDAETARDMAEASTRAKSAFVANISHEIRTPLNALLGMAQLLERSDLDRAQKSHVKVLLEAGSGLKTLLDDVIALSRDEGEAHDEKEDGCDAAQAARTVARVLQPKAWEKQVKLSVTTGSNLPRVAADPRRVRQVLLKLADNALKFTHRGCVELRVSSHRTEDALSLRFTVTDTGLGIPSESLDTLFEPFAASDNSYARRTDGAGLGLAVAKRVVEQLGGEIGLESEPGVGSTFWFTVPAMGANGTEQREAVPIAADAPPPWGLSILLWCADEAIGGEIVNMLEPFGNRLVPAQSLSDAIGLAGRESFDAVIVDANAADSMAAAPGVRAPILAVVSGGMRLPAAIAEILRWPARAGVLYGSLRELLGRGAEAGARLETEAQTIAAIDAPAFAALEKSLGLETMIEILHAYIATAETLCVGLANASDKEGWDDATRIAHDIAGAAGGLGLAALMAAARNFAQKVREGGDPSELKGAAQTIVAEHTRVRRALANLYPELVA